MGSISPSIGNLTKLELLIVNSNPLTGTIPIEIGLCEELGERNFF
jgi:Leucine-rich repeat (LRR) protein